MAAGLSPGAALAISCAEPQHPGGDSQATCSWHPAESVWTVPGMNNCQAWYLNTWTLNNEALVASEQVGTVSSTAVVMAVNLTSAEILS